MKPNFFAQGLLFLHFILIILGMIVGLPFWENWDWSQINEQAYWQEIIANHLWASIGAFISIMFSGGLIAGILGLRIALFFRQFDRIIRKKIERILNIIAFIPCLAWALFYVLMFNTISGTSIFIDIGLGILTLFSMAFPMLVYLNFQHINDVSNELIETGYSLGANSTQIAKHLILPQKIKMIGISMLLVYVRLIIEVGVIFMVLNIIDLNTISILTIFILTTISIGTLLLWGRDG